MSDQTSNHSFLDWGSHYEYEPQEHGYSLPLEENELRPLTQSPPRQTRTVQTRTGDNGYKERTWAPQASEQTDQAQTAELDYKARIRAVLKPPGQGRRTSANTLRTRATPAVASNFSNRQPLQHFDQHQLGVIDPKLLDKRLTALEQAQAVEAEFDDTLLLDESQVPGESAIFGLVGPQLVGPQRDGLFLTGIQSRRESLIFFQQNQGVALSFLTCSICNHSCSNEWVLRHHMTHANHARITRINALSEPDPLQCDICSQICISKRAFSVHHLSMHEGAKSYRSPY